MNSVYYFAKYDADDTGNVVHAHESYASGDTPWGSGNGLREPCGIRVIVGDVESPTVDCPADLITNTVQLPTAMYDYDNLPPNSGLQVGESFAEVDLFYGDAQFMDNIVPLAGTDDLSALFVTMKIISRGSNAGTPTGFIDEGMTEFNIGTTVVEYKVMDGSGYTAMWAKCEMQITVLDQEEPGEANGPRGTIGCPADDVGGIPRTQETELNVAYAEIALASSDVVAVDNSGVISTTEIRFRANAGGGNFDSVAPVAEGSHQFSVGNFGTPAEHTIQYSAIDPSNNVGDCEITVTVVDAQDPVLSCPDDLIGDGTGFSTDVGENYYAVSMQGLAVCADIEDSSACDANPSCTYDVSGSSCEVTDAAADSHLVNGAVCRDNTGCGIIEVRYGAIDGPLIVEGNSQATYNFELNAGLTETHEVYFVATDSPCEQCQQQLGQDSVGCSYFCSTTNNNDPSQWDGGEPGNVGHCVWTVIVKDTEAPVLTCPETITSSSVTGADAATAGSSLDLANGLPTDASTSPGQVEGYPYKTLTIQDAVVVDNSEEVLSFIATMVNPGGDEVQISSAQQFPIGSTTVTYTATDNSGNLGTCTTTVEVVDLEDPIMVCPDAVTLDTDAGLPYATFDLPTPDSGTGTGHIADNSGIVTYVAEIDVDTSDPLNHVLEQPSIVPHDNNLHPNRFYYGDTIVRYTATDPAGRTSTCLLSIEVTDNEPPQLTCPPDITRDTDGPTGLAASCTGADDGTGTACTLNGDGTACAVAGPDCVYTPSHEFVGFPHRTIAIQGADTVASDNAVFGTIPPLIVTASIGGTDISVGTTEVQYDFPIGVTVVRYSASDYAAHSTTTANMGECLFTVTVQDNEDPVMTCPPDVMVSTTPYDADNRVAGRDPANTSGSPSAVVDLIAATVRDNSEEVLAVVGVTGPQSFDIGVHTVTYQASDSYGQSSTCDVTVTVEDDEAPILVCPPDVSVDLLQNNRNYRELTVSADLGFAVVTDNNDLAGVATPVATVEAAILDSAVDITNPPASGGHHFPCCENSPTTVTFTAVDGDGNVGTCTMLVTVVDVQDPVLTCGAVPELLTHPASMTQPSGVAYHTLVMEGPSIADNSGETLIATAVIVQADRIEESLDATVDGQGALVTPVAITYDSDTTAYTHNFFIGTSIVRFTAIDSTGRSGSCETVVTVVDNEDPVIVGSVVVGTTRHCIPDVQLDRITGTCQNSNGDTVDLQPLCEAIIVNTFASTWDNVAGNCVKENGDIISAPEACMYTGQNTWLYGHHSWQGLIPRVTITDNSGADIAPVAYIGNPVANVVIEVNTDDPNKVGPVELPISQLSGGHSTITFTATDHASNEVQCELRVLVLDIEDPILTCPEDATVNTANGNTAAVTIPDAGVVDNSETSVGEYIDVLQPTAALYNAQSNQMVDQPIGSEQTFTLDGSQEYTQYLITYTSSDAAGNVNTCVWTLTIADNAGPVVICPANENAVTSGIHTAEVGLTRAGQPGGPTATDNSLQVNDPYLHPNDGLVNVFTRIQPSPSQCGQIPYASRTQYGCETSGIPCDLDGRCDNEIVGIFEIGTHVVTYIAADAAGNTGTCEMEVVVRDMEPPVVTCPSDRRGESGHETTDTHSPTKAITLDRLGGAGSSAVEDNSCHPNNPCQAIFAIPSVIDPDTGNRVDLVTAQTLDNDGRNIQPYEFPIGTTEVRYTAIDPSNQQGICVQRIEVRDTEAPRLTCPTQNVYPTSASTGYALVTIHGPTDVTVLENSGEDLASAIDATFTREWHPDLEASVNLDVGSTASPNQNEATVHNGVWAFPIGITNVMYHVTDSAGNTGTCSIQLLVEDVEDPILPCPSILDADTNHDEPVATVGIMGPGSTASVLDNNPADTNACAYEYTSRAGADNEAKCLALAGCTYDSGSDSCSGEVYLVPHAEYAVGTSECANVPAWYDAGLAVGCEAFDDPDYAAAYCSSDPCTGAGMEVDEATCEGAGACAFVPGVAASCSGSGTQSTCTGSTPDDNSLTCTDYDGQAAESCPSGCTYAPAVVCALNGDSSGCEDLADGACTFDQGSGNSCNPRYGSVNGVDTAASDACCACGGGEYAGQAPVAGQVACPANTYFSAGECIAVIATETAIDFPIGQTDVTYYATDSHDNTGHCVATITVVDNQPPGLNCPAALQFNSDPLESFALVDVDNIAVFPTIGASDVSDNSGEDLINTIRPNIIDTDTCGQFSQNAGDTPEAQCLGTDPACTFDSTDDTCSGSIYVELSGDTQFQIGTTAVYFTAEDAAGNVGFCTMDVVVLDNEVPQLTCPADVSVTTDAEMPFSSVTLENAQVIDNSGVHPVDVANIDPSSPIGRCADGSTPLMGGIVYTSEDWYITGTDFDISTATGTLAECQAACDAEASCAGFSRATAAADGDSVDCSLKSAVDGPAAPHRVTGDWSTYIRHNTDLCDDGSDILTVISFTHNFLMGACPVDFPFHVTNDEYGVAGIVCFNSAETAALSTGADGTWCLLEQFAAEDRASDLQAIVADPGTSSAYCNPTAAKSATTVLFTATDEAGNVGSCTMTVTVQDNEVPVLTCPSDQSISTDANSPTATVTFETASVIDNSGTTLYAVTDRPEGAFPIGASVLTYSATDASGNIGECQINVFVNDDEAPILSCPADLAADSDSGESYATMALELPVVVDNSGETPTATAVRDMPGWVDLNGFDCAPFDDTNHATVYCSDAGIVNSAGVTAAEACMACGGGEIINASPVPTFELGATVVTYFATDSARTSNLIDGAPVTTGDNTGFCTYTITISDNQVPGVVCPLNQVQYTNQPVGDAAVGDPFATVTLSTAAVTDNSDAVLMAYATVNGVLVGPNQGQGLTQTLADLPRPAFRYDGSSFPSHTFTAESWVIDAKGPNIAAQATATSPDGLDPDGAGDADAATDSDDNTYWDQEDNAAGPHILQLAFPGPTFIGAYSFSGFAANDFIAKSWRITCDGNTIDEQTDVAYTVNSFERLLPYQECTTVQMRITAWYGSSPAVREFGLYQGQQSYTGTLAECEEACGDDALCEGFVRETSVADGDSGTCWVVADISATQGANSLYRTYVKEDVGAGTVVLCEDFATREGSTNQEKCEAWCGAGACGCTMNLGTGACTGFPAAVYDVVYSATDDESNTGTCTMQVTIIDTQIPVLSCPGPQTVPTTVETTVAAVTLQPAVVTDNSGESLTATAAREDGTSVVIGAGLDGNPPNLFEWTGDAPRGVVYINVIYSATDSSGNTGTCTITVTVPELDDCAEQPCVHGTCTDQIGSYQCTCEPGWSGEDCDVDIDECSFNPCQDPGTALCQDSTTTKPTEDGGDGLLQMGCPPETGGEYAYNADYANCIPVNTYLCTCQDRYSGFDCEFLDECSFDPCHRSQAAEDDGRLLYPALLDDFFKNVGPQEGSVVDPTRFFCDASNIVESFNGEGFERFLCVDPDKTVTGDFYCRCPTCAETIFESGDATALTTYFTAHPSMQLHILGEVRKDQQTNGECVDLSIPREGCMDPLATNYDNLANMACSDPPGATSSAETCVSTDPVTVDPGCALAILDGNPATCHAAATTGAGGCTYTAAGCPCLEARLGCMIPEAQNYNPLATVDDPNDPCRVELTPTDECANNPCENVYYFQTNAVFPAGTRAGSTDGVCEEPWVCTEPNEYVLNDYQCTCPQAVCGLDNIFPDVTNFDLSIFLHRENTLKAHLLGQIAQPTTVGGCECMASWIVDDSVGCPVAAATGEPVCYETASTSVAADALACASVSDLTTGDECGAVVRAGGGGPACTYGAAYNGCGMDPPCDGNDGGVVGNSYCEVVDPAACTPDGSLGGLHDFCVPSDHGPGAIGRRLLAGLAAEMGAPSNSTAAAANASSSL